MGPGKFKNQRGKVKPKLHGGSKQNLAARVAKIKIK